MVDMETYQLDQVDGPLETRLRRPGLIFWLGGCLVLVFAMVIVGGATRLTESGLSITEWNLVLGMFPPLTENAWMSEFDLYRQTPQYELLNQGMSLSEFKLIYWWEWGHRQLGRFIGLFYLAGYLLLLLRRSLSVKEAATLFCVGLLLMMQGFVGWIMVASGLEPGMTAVAPVKLTLHLVLACLFFVALIFCLVRFGGIMRAGAKRSASIWAYTFLALVLLQIALGGLVAGYDAGLAYNTWPLMDGSLLPSGLLAADPVWMNVIGNVKSIQFNHRLGAYVLAVIALTYWAIVLRSDRTSERSFAWHLFVMILIQIALGVLTLINMVPIGLALAHQGLGLLILGIVAWQAARIVRV